MAGMWRHCVCFGVVMGVWVSGSDSVDISLALILTRTLKRVLAYVFVLYSGG